ncbi:MAG: radical SAM protein, partial [Gemmatimonadaceae bacterium]
ICENGLVHYCSQQRGHPGTPLAQYSLADIRREFLSEKGCAPRCTVSCVHQISYIDHWRAPQRGGAAFLPPHRDDPSADPQEALVQLK